MSASWGPYVRLMVGRWDKLVGYPHAVIESLLPAALAPSGEKKSKSRPILMPFLGIGK